MTTGEKLAKLRKEHGHTQEDLADLLGVSRQAVGKWETDTAYPETDKLVRIGELYGCSMDYLLKSDDSTHEKTDAPPENNGSSLSVFLRSLYFERKSKRMIGKLPLWHINIGFGRVATGVFAVGLVSRGLVSVGLLSAGLLSLGVLSLGLIALGTLSVGILSFGAIVLGVIAFGAIAIGLLSVGAIAVGEYAVGALARGGIFAMGDHAYAPIAVGKTLAQGDIYTAAAVNRPELLDLLYAHTPAAFRWAYWLVTPCL